MELLDPVHQMWRRRGRRRVRGENSPALDMLHLRRLGDIQWRWPGSCSGERLELEVWNGAWVACMWTVPWGVRINGEDLSPGAPQSWRSEGIGTTLKGGLEGKASEVGGKPGVWCLEVSEVRFSKGVVIKRITGCGSPIRWHLRLTIGLGTQSRCRAWQELHQWSGGGESPIRAGSREAGNRGAEAVITDTSFEGVY